MYKHIFINTQLYLCIQRQRGVEMLTNYIHTYICIHMAIRIDNTGQYHVANTQPQLLKNILTILPDHKEYSQFNLSQKGQMATKS